LEEGCIALSTVQQHNLHALYGESYTFSLFTLPPDGSGELAEVEADVRLLREEDNLNEVVEVDAAVLSNLLAKQLLGQVIAVNEGIVAEVSGAELLVKIRAADSLDAEAREEAVGYHCYRGLVTPETTFWLSQSRTGHHVSHGLEESTSAAASEVDQGKCGDPGLRLKGCRRRPQSSSGRHTINVLTLDGETFPVKRKLLRSCIALTSELRGESEEPPTVSLDVDTLTFDRVLIFLEALAVGNPAPNFGVRLLEQLCEAARKLGLRSLEDHCNGKLVDMDSRLRVYSFEEVKTKNAAGFCWLILDGMILDVTRWLPEHPGGSKIIPAQSLNIESSRFFEVFHATRESFLYIKEFYIGELDPSDRSLVSCEVPPSQDFLQQLREYTGFRMEVAQKVFKSF